MLDGIRRDGADLGWSEEERTRFPEFAKFAERACERDPNRRFANAGEAFDALRSLDLPIASSRVALPAGPVPLRPMVVPRVIEILRSYPGSRFGNPETRGLNSWFATDTYVETGLDQELSNAILAGEAGLVILCGNAGDGKTALLQHLATKLGVHDVRSDRRIHDATVGALRIMINLDGAAAWNGRSADELLDETFEPFHNARPTDRVHLVAVNDGRLLEWIETPRGAPRRNATDPTDC